MYIYVCIYIKGFGASTTYSDEFYTTQLDKSKVQGPTLNPPTHARCVFIPGVDIKGFMSPPLLSHDLPDPFILKVSI